MTTTTPTRQKQWEKMQPRERDAWIAKHVMGLDVRGPALVASYESASVLTGRERWHGKPGDGYHSMQPVFVQYPDQAALQPGEEEYECCGVNVSYLAVVDRYTTTADADYQVLVKVRETWGEKQQQEFECQLMSLYHHHGRTIAALDDAGDFGYITMAMEYRIGDYSLAAYLAMEDE